MTHHTRRDFLRNSAKGGLFLGAQALGFEEIIRRIAPGPIYGTPLRRSRTVDMIDFLLPTQSYDDAKQFHTVGYMLYNYPSHVPRVDGGFMKMARVTPKPGEAYENEVARYIVQKAPRHPCEYSVVLEEDPIEEPVDDEPPLPRPHSPFIPLAMAKEKKKVRVSYLKTEVMAWTDNNISRNYPLGNGYPTFMWGRSDAVQPGLNPQYIGRCDWDFCGTKENTSEIIYPGAIAVWGPYPLEGTTDYLDTIVRDLGTLGSLHPLAPRDETRNQLIAFRDLAYSRNLKKPRLLAISGGWGIIDPSKPLSDDNVWYRERYDGLCGEEEVVIDGGPTTVMRTIGAPVGWHFQELMDGDPRAGLVTMQEGIQTTVVKEEEPILPLMPCEPVPDAHARVTLAATMENPYLFAGIRRRYNLKDNNITGPSQ